LYFICCKILGVPPGSDEETIRTAYRKSAKELHPDVNNSEKAHEYFVILQNAYEYLLKHPHSAAEISFLKRKAMQEENRKKMVEYIKKQQSQANNYSLSYILKNSSTARILFFVFHILFITIGLWLIIRSVYGVFFYEIVDKTELFSKYIAITFGFIFGLVLTSIFLYTGISYIRNR